MTSQHGSSATRRQYATAMGALAAGAGLAWWALSRPWLEAQAPLLPGADVTGGVAVVSVTGSELVPTALALTIVGFAGIAGIVATSGVVRRAIGAVVGASGALTIIAVIGYWVGSDVPDALPSDAVGISRIAVPSLLAGVGGGLMLFAGLVVAGRGHQWPGLGRKYERTGAQQPKDAWDALDRGLDPTVDDPPASR